MNNKYPKFGRNQFLLEHIQSILDFYDGRCCDEKNGGYFQFFKVFVRIVKDKLTMKINLLSGLICILGKLWKCNYFSFRITVMFMTRKQGT